MKYVKSEIPTIDGFIRPVLRFATRRSGLFAPRDITDAPANHFNLSTEARKKLTRGGNINRVYNLTSRSIPHLKRAEFLRQAGGDLYGMTDAGGKEVVSSNEISVSRLMQNVPAYQRWKQGKITQEV